MSMMRIVAAVTGKQRRHNATRHSGRHAAYYRGLRFEPLEMRALLAAVPFSAQLFVDALDADNPREVLTADLDNDGDADVVSGSYDDGRIAWYENRLDEPAGDIGPPQVIDDGGDWGLLVFASDLDSDGDLDLLSATDGEFQVAWYENRLNEASSDFGPQQVVLPERHNEVPVFAGDLDGDADPDILALSVENWRVVWYVNQLNEPVEGFGPRLTIGVLDTSSGANVTASDLDGDGDLDVLAGFGGNFDSKISWFENRVNEPTRDFAPERPIPFVQGRNKIDDLITADPDGDGDQDIIVAHYRYEISWIENRLDEPTGGFAPQRIIASYDDPEDVLCVGDLAASDLDGDGDQDLLTGFQCNGNTVVWYENRLDEATGDFSAWKTITDENYNTHGVFASDLDGDGDLDVLSTSGTDDKVVWHENRLDEATADFGPEQALTRSTNHANSVFATDLDRDGDADILTASRSDDKVSWYENRLEGGTAEFGPQQVITTSTDDAHSVFASDLDGDGDPDVLSASRNDDKIAWYQNQLDQLSGFGPQQVINASADRALSVFASDLDGDGDPDVLSASAADSKVAWYENQLDEGGGIGSERVISVDRYGALSVFASDLDGDGDMDVLSASGGVNTIVWFENRLNEATVDFGPQQVVTTEADGAFSVFAIDLDGDGDPDILSASRDDDKIAWYENRLDELTGDFGPQQVITTDADRAYSVFASDLDGDGDPDVLSASREDDKIAWYENRLDESTGDFGSEQVITTEADGATSVYAADLDNDGDQDVLSASSGDGKVAWYRNERIGQPGDLDLDGEVSVEDIEHFIQALIDPAGYQADHLGLLPAARGDIDGDGDVDLDDVDGFVRLMTGEGSGGGQAVGAHSVGAPAASAPERTAAVKGSSVATKEASIPHFVPETAVRLSPRAHDAVMAEMGVFSPAVPVAAFAASNEEADEGPAGTVGEGRRISWRAVDVATDEVHETVWGEPRDAWCTNRMWR